MGHRANYVVVAGGKRELWYSHWTANTLTRDLFWGPEHALPFIRRQQPTDEWLDDVWCEGAALLDLDSKALILFGGEDIKFDPPLRRVYLRLLAHVWAGWSIRWAFEGLVDVVESLGLDRSIVLADGPEHTPITPGEAGEWIASIASVRWEDGRIGLYAMNVAAEQVVAYGAGLVALLNDRSAARTLAVSADCSGGVHIDVAAKKIDFWRAGPEEDAQARAAAHWPGWRVEWHRDSFEHHAALTDGALTFTTPSDDELVERLTAILEVQSGRHHGEMMRDLVVRLAAEEGKPWEINPVALVDAPQSISDEERRRILLSSIRADRRR